MVRLVYGASLLLAPGAVIRLASGRSADGLPVAVARILGVRHVAQALTLDRAEARGWTLLGASVDLLHAASMVGAAVLSEDCRRAAALDAALALRMAACGLREVEYG